MIQYSNINDVWGNKEMYKKKETFVNNTNNKIEPNINIENNRIYEKKILRENLDNTHNNDCSMIEHLDNCPTCKQRIMEMFQNKTEPEANFATVNLYFFKINITKDVLKLIFVLLVILIFIVLLSIINVPLIGNNNSSAKYYLVPQNELNNLVRLGIH